MLFNRLLPIAVALFFFAGGMVVIFWPSYFYLTAALAVIMIAYGAWRISADRRIFWRTAILPINAAVSFFALMVFINRAGLRFLLLTFSSALVYIYFRRLFYRSFAPGPGHQADFFTIGRISGQTAIIFASVCLYAVETYLNIAVGYLILPYLFLGGLTMYAILRPETTTGASAVFYALVGGIIMAELAWAVSFLPVKYLVAGFIMAVAYYLYINLTLAYLAGRLTSRTVRWQIGLGLGGLLAVLLTARWF